MTPAYLKNELRELRQKGWLSRPGSPYGQLNPDKERGTQLAIELLKYIDKLEGQASCTSS